MRAAIAALLLLVALTALADSEHTEETRWEAFTIDELREEREAKGRSYVEFLRVDSMFAGFYELQPDDFDRQTPHDRDELYHVVAGRAVLRVDDERVEVRPGSVIFVARDVEHRFEEIEEPLSVLVFFSDAED